MGRGSDVARRALLVVDGYNVIHGNARYQALIDEHAGAGALADVAHLSRDPYGHDPYERAREALVTDVAAYAQGSYEPVVVYDGAGNLNPERPNRPVAGVEVVFSRTGESADTVIERLVTKARGEGRDVLLVTSDNTIRFTVGGIPVTTVSSQLLAADIEIVDRDVSVLREERTHGRLTLADRLDPATRAKLDKLLGRQ
ncbi:MAG: NYN domain-containing protein [Atopobiaceae bacterium]|nr:NYN domain-containing protein [Atopobiaceae bacterium]MBQ6411339.1 NYN domain-containing protein [Atopobiaceae bacterium]MBQ6651529.1 NYN domain-containing protein [Atopobiaceae bacterium]MBR3383756.1 NYN domain-containing protein [Atopobiaceae bacterium]